MKRFEKLGDDAFVYMGDLFHATVVRLDGGWKAKVWRKRGADLYLMDSALYPAAHLGKNFVWSVIHEELQLLVRDWADLKFKNAFVQGHG